MNTESPVSSESKASKIGITAVLGAYMSIVITLLALNFTDFYGVDEHPSQPTMECMSPEDNCTVFQPVNELPVRLPNPYKSTAGGQEAMNGHIPPALTVRSFVNEYAMRFEFGEQSTKKTGHEFILPLTDNDKDVIYNEYRQMATVINMVAGLNGVTQLMVFDGSISVNHTDDADVDSLKDQIVTIIGHFG